MLIGCSWDRKGSCKEFNGKRGSRNIKNKIGRKKGIFFKRWKSKNNKEWKILLFLPVSTKPLRKFSSLTFNFKTCQCIQSSFKSCFVFLDAGLQLENSNLLLGLMKVLSPALHYLALLRGGWSSKGYIIYKALWDRAGRKTLLLITYTFFLLITL